MIIPYKELSPEALNGVIEQFVSRDGPDSGHVDVPIKRKIEQVIKQLESGKAVIVFVQETETCTILKSDDPVLKDLDG